MNKRLLFASLGLCVVSFIAYLALEESRPKLAPAPVEAIGDTAIVKESSPCGSSIGDLHDMFDWILRGDYEEPYRIMKRTGSTFVTQGDTIKILDATSNIRKVRIVGFSADRKATLQKLLGIDHEQESAYDKECWVGPWALAGFGSTEKKKQSGE